jgi:capsular polysaccharide biosynthesis protein
MPANQPEPMKSQSDNPEDEIELIDLLRVVWKWKYLIIGGTAVCALAAVIISLNMVPVYSIEMVLTPGILKMEGNKKIFIDSPNNVKALIESGAINNQILSQLDTHKSDSVPNSLKFKVTMASGSSMIKVAYETADTDQGIEILKLGRKLLIEKYSHLVKYYQKDYEMQLNMKNFEREKFLLSLQSSKKNLKIIDSRIADLRSEIELINKNTDELIRDQQKFLSQTKDENDILPALVYSNTIQQNMSLANSYKNQLNSYEIKLESEKQVLLESERKIKNLRIEIKNLEFKTNDIENIQILKPPTVSTGPIKPKKKMIVILATMVGLFMMVFLSFFLEYISKNKVH